MGYTIRVGQSRLVANHREVHVQRRLALLLRVLPMTEDIQLWQGRIGVAVVPLEALTIVLVLVERMSWLDYLDHPKSGFAPVLSLPIPSGYYVATGLSPVDRKARATRRT